MNLAWARNYQLSWLADDLRIAVFATLILIPQALAYAALAGLPPYYGLYASILPLLVYAFLGSSPILSVGPVAITSLMTASALLPLGLSGQDYIHAAAILTLLSAFILLAFYCLRLGTIAYFLSQPVVSGFISGAAIIIIISQIPALLGISLKPSAPLLSLFELSQKLSHADQQTAMIGLGSLCLLIACKQYLGIALQRLGLKPSSADLLSRSAPMLIVLLAGLISVYGQLSIAAIGDIPKGLPLIQLPQANFTIVPNLLLPALFIALIGFVQSIAIARVAAAKRQEKVKPNRELLGLGFANMAASFSGSMPVSGSFTRTAITMQGGSNSPVANLLCLVLVLLVLLWGVDLLAQLPLAVLAATIIVAVSNLIDLASFKKAWRYNKHDAFALLATFISVLTFNVEIGIITGISLSLFSVIWRASYPHIAVIGRVAGSQYYRNILNYQAETHPKILMLRIDENLFFANAQIIEDRIQQELAQQTQVEHIALVMYSVSHIDSTALDMLEKLNGQLQQQGRFLHLCDVKNTVLSSLKQSSLLNNLSGEVFLTASEADLALRNQYHDSSE